MKILNYILSGFAAAALCFGASSCVGDLDVTPIDPNVTLPEDVLNSESAYQALLAKCYQALCVSSSYGVNGDPDISGIDGGFGQFYRAMFYMNEYTTDEATCPWNDGTVQSLHGLNWTTSDNFIYCMYSRLYYEISLCNEVIRQIADCELSFKDSSNMKAYTAEARALRLLCYYYVIDMFGGGPFSSESDSVGSTGPDYITRADLFEWAVEEAEAILADGNLAKIAQGEYGRVDEGFIKMIQAKLYLNAPIYLGETSANYYSQCASVCNEIINAYPTLYSNYAGLFSAENDLRWRNHEEIIFAAEQDADYIQSYGVTTFIIKSAVEANNDTWMAALGVSDGWGGINVTPQFLDIFDSGDARNMFWGGGPSGDWPSDLSDILDFSTGWTSYKFTNNYEDGTYNSNTSFCDTDLPVFRAADAYLMLAEAELRNGGLQSDGLAAWNAVRTRAGLDTISSGTLDEMLNERGRELYWECFRRSDLIRFGKFTTSDYLWAYKGGNDYPDGIRVDDKYNLMPIPATEINTNSKLQQNPGY
ncbi:MAG: RagB/SusD family nutrient uptake outer membrane protein [Bacteroidales bacterium]|nr:RagB/SusD family nutrient uptake outer membrane protein [Bacteroidales bacterium]